MKMNDKTANELQIELQTANELQKLQMNYKSNCKTAKLQKNDKIEIVL